MLPLELARELTTRRLPWEPQRGDRFVVPDRDMDDEVFVVSDLTVEVQDVPSGLVLAFGGTTEWALDSLRTDQVLWLPREDQLREALGDLLLRLEQTPAGWSVLLVDGRSFADPDVESAYARALLATA